MGQFVSGVPWGMGRVSDRLPIPAPGYARVELDPVTQLARYFDTDGQVVEMGKHGTSKTRGSASFSGDSDGQGPQPQRQDDNITDYDQD